MASEAAKLAENLEYGFYDRLTPTQLASELAARSIDSSTARPNSSCVQLLLRDDIDAKRAAIDHNKNSPLIMLPPELRNYVFSMVIDHHKTIFRAQGYNANSVYWGNWFHEPTLLQVCNTIRRETIPVFFATRHWNFNDNDSDGPQAMTTMQTWASEIGHERLGAGREIKVRVEQVTLVKRGGEYLISINGTINEAEMQTIVGEIKKAIG